MPHSMFGGQFNLLSFLKSGIPLEKIYSSHIFVIHFIFIFKHKGVGTTRDSCV